MQRTYIHYPLHIIKKRKPKSSIIVLKIQFCYKHYTDFRMETQKNRRKRRTKADIEKSINDATIQLIREKGFAGVTVTGITQLAKIEPAVFYNRYDDLEQYLSEFVKSYDYWFSEVAEKSKAIEDPKQRYKSLVRNLFISLKENKIMQELLKWELSTNNETSQRTARLREFHTLPLIHSFEKLFKDSAKDFGAITALIVSGLYYLILHNDVSEFGGIDINNAKGEERILSSVDYLSDILFSENNPETRY